MRVLRELLVHGGRATLHLTLQEEVRQARDVRAVRPARVDARQPAPAESPGPSRVRLRGWKTVASATSPGPHGRTAASTGPSVAEWLVLGAQRSKTPIGSVLGGQGSSCRTIKAALPYVLANVILDGNRARGLAVVFGFPWA
jgi:hypothetical protein